jgi:hypothetical protein
MISIFNEVLIHCKTPFFLIQTDLPLIPNPNPAYYLKPSVTVVNNDIIVRQLMNPAGNATKFLIYFDFFFLKFKKYQNCVC